MKTYRISWTVLNTDGTRTSSNKPSKVQFCNNELDAKMKLEVYLRKVLPKFGSLICQNCVELNAVSDLFQKFGF